MGAYYSSLLGRKDNNFQFPQNINQNQNPVNVANAVDETSSVKPVPELAATTEPTIAGHRPKAVEFLSHEEIEQEFNKIHQRSYEILNSLHRNPCETLRQRIQSCLAENAQNMTNCSEVMSSYQKCLADERSERLLKMLTNFQMD